MKWKNVQIDFDSFEVIANFADFASGRIDRQGRIKNIIKIIREVSEAYAFLQKYDKSKEKHPMM